MEKVQSLEDHSRRPHQTRQWEVDFLQEQRIVALRKKHLKYGKKKLKVLYQSQYQEPISTWKIERVVRKHKLYPDPEKYQKRLKRQRKRKNKLRINQLKTQPQAGKLWHTDTMISKSSIQTMALSLLESLKKPVNS